MDEYSINWEWDAHLLIVDIIILQESKFATTTDLSEREVISELVDGCRQKMGYVQDEIEELQRNLCEMDGNKVLIIFLILNEISSLCSASIFNASAEPQNRHFEWLIIICETPLWSILQFSEKKSLKDLILFFPLLFLFSFFFHIVSVDRKILITL